MGGGEKVVVDEVDGEAARALARSDRLVGFAEQQVSLALDPQRPAL